MPILIKTGIIKYFGGSTMKKIPTFVLGHKNPDTDSICASIAYAELKKVLGDQDVVPVRLGELNKETKYILNYFEVEEPILIETVRAQVSDLDYYKEPFILQDRPIGEAWDTMMREDRRMIPVVDEKKNLMGLITMGDIAREIMQLEDINSIADYKPTLQNIITMLKADVIAGDLKRHKDSILGGNIILGLYPEQISNEVKTAKDIIIIWATEELLKASLNTVAHHIFIIGECKHEWLKYFKNIDKDKIILCAKHDAYNTIKLINNSIPVSSIMTTDNLIVFYETDYLADVKKTINSSRFRYFAILSEEGKVIGTFSRRHIVEAEKKKVIIVDHNEYLQSVHGLDEAEVLEIIDHHRVGDIQTSGPIMFRNEPVGSSSTIVASMYFEQNITPKKEIAGLLLSAIISDTLLFKSPASTLTDKIIAEKLSKIAKVNIDEYGFEMLRAGASIKGLSMKEIINIDYKEFNISGKKIFISQVCTTDPNQVFEIKEEMLELMNKMCKKGAFNFGGLMVTDILGSGTQFLFTGKDKELAKKAFGANLDSNIVFLPKVVSRKIEIIPPMSRYI